MFECVFTKKNCFVNIGFHRFREYVFFIRDDVSEALTSVVFDSLTVKQIVGSDWNTR
jgi:hypothetical protein